MIKQRDATRTQQRHILEGQATARGRAGSFSTRISTSRPTICVANEASESLGDACPTTRPRRITVISSATARTSRSLCVINTIEVPASAS